MWHSVRRTVEQVVHSLCPEIVFSYWAHPDGAVAQKTAELAGVPCVNMVGGSDVLIEARSSRRGTQIRRVIEASDHLVAVSRNIASELEAMGNESARVSVVPRGIDRSVYYPGDGIEAREHLGISTDALVVFGCGRLVPVKDWMLFLDTCTVLTEHCPRLTVAIAGDGPLRKELQTRIQSTGLTDRIQLVGALNPHELAQWYRAADCTLLTSRSEGIPNVLLESISCGTGFVSTDVGGIRSIYDSSRDRLVAGRCPVKLAAAVQSIHQTSPVTPRRYLPPSWDDCGAHLAAVFEAVLQNKSFTLPESSIISSQSGVYR